MQFTDTQQKYASCEECIWCGSCGNSDYEIAVVCQDWTPASDREPDLADAYRIAFLDYIDQFERGGAEDGETAIRAAKYF